MRRVGARQFRRIQRTFIRDPIEHKHDLGVEFPLDQEPIDPYLPGYSNTRYRMHESEHAIGTIDMVALNYMASQQTLPFSLGEF